MEENKMECENEKTKFRMTGDDDGCNYLRKIAENTARCYYEESREPRPFLEHDDGCNYLRQIARNTERGD